MSELVVRKRLPWILCLCAIAIVAFIVYQTRDTISERLSKEPEATKKVVRIEEVREDPRSQVQASKPVAAHGRDFKLTTPVVQPPSLEEQIFGPLAEHSPNITWSPYDIGAPPDRIERLSKWQLFFEVYPKYYLAIRVDSMKTETDANGITRSVALPVDESDELYSMCLELLEIHAEKTEYLGRQAVRLVIAGKATLFDDYDDCSGADIGPCLRVPGGKFVGLKRGLLEGLHDTEEFRHLAEREEEIRAHIRLMSADFSGYHFAEYDFGD